jgi:hypothetical protein
MLPSGDETATFAERSPSPEKKSDMETVRPSCENGAGFLPDRNCSAAVWAR